MGKCDVWKPFPNLEAKDRASRIYAQKMSFSAQTRARKLFFASIFPSLARIVTGRGLKTSNQGTERKKTFPSLFVQSIL